MADPPASRRRLVPRINDLPDEMLRNVLFCLSSRDAVRSCMLSKRWRNLWKAVPRIDADISDFDDKGYSAEQCEVLLKNFTNSYLEARDPVPLQEFRLWYSVCRCEYPYAEDDDEDAQFAEDDDEEAQFADAPEGDEEAQFAEDDDEEARSADVPEEDEQDKSADANRWIRYALEHQASVIVVLNQLYHLNLAHAGITSNYLKSLDLTVLF